MKSARFSERIDKKPLLWALLFFLAAVSCIALLTFGLAGYSRFSYVKGAIRAFFGAAGAALIIMRGNRPGLGAPKPASKNIDIIIAALIIAANNFPIISLASGKASVNAGAGEFAVFLFFCFSVGLFEEVYFRGLIFPMLLLRFGNKKYGAFIAASLSSAAFSLVHLFNLSANPPEMVMLQLGYTFLLGMLYAVLYYMTRSLWLAVFCHALYDAGGFLIEYAGKGEIWDLPTVVLTVALSAAVFLWVAFRFWRFMVREDAARRNTGNIRV